LVGSLLLIEEDFLLSLTIQSSNSPYHARHLPAKGNIGFILVFSHDSRAPCCGFLIVAMLILRTPPRTPKLCPNRLPQSGASPSRSLLGINDLPSPTALSLGVRTLRLQTPDPTSSTITGGTIRVLSRTARTDLFSQFVVTRGKSREHIAVSH
jgi:hypothetical protein